MVVFACSNSLANAFETRLLGAYDGSGAWQIYATELRGSEEQRYVEMHEGLHHELQSSTGWGLVSAMSAELAIRGHRPAELSGLYERMVDLGRTVHEMFATAVSSFVVGEDRARELLIDNLLYTDYLRMATGLVPRIQTPGPRFHQAAVTAVLRVLMSPSSSLRLLDRGFDRLTASDLVDERNTPQERLRAYQILADAIDWGDVLGALADKHPSQVGQAWGSTEVETLPDEVSQEFLARRVFEEEVLLPHCFREVARALEAAGLGTVPFDGQAALAFQVKSSVEAVDPELAARLNVVTERRPVADDGLQYDRQQIVLREKLPAVVHRFTGSVADCDLLTWEGRNGSTMLGLWLSRAAARKQWQFEPDDSDALPGIVRALAQLGTTRTTATHVAILATVPQIGPRQLQTRIGEETPLVALTTSSSLADDGLVAELHAVEPVFVLMDLPVAHQVAYWTEQGASVRMAASRLPETNTDLMLLAFTVAEAPAFTFLSLGGTVATSMLIERLRRVHPESLIIDPEAILRHRSGVELAVTKILALWHVLDQDGTENRRRPSEREPD